MGFPGITPEDISILSKFGMKVSRSLINSFVEDLLF